jgi:hypothetical protein
MAINLFKPNQTNTTQITLKIKLGWIFSAFLKSLQPINS